MCIKMVKQDVMTPLTTFVQQVCMLCDHISFFFLTCRRLIIFVISTSPISAPCIIIYSAFLYITLVALSLGIPA